jgi:RimJ/RimL family protein N-acetyltransferase
MSRLRLETARLTLVPISLELVDALADRSAAERLLGFAVPESFPNPDLAEFLPVYAGRLAADPALLGFGPWVAAERERRIVVGGGGFVGRPGEDGTIELGYGVDEGFQGRGYATELAAELVRWGFAQPGVRRVVARCDPGNAPSVRVLEKLGMRRTGEQDGLLTWEADGLTASPPN